MKSRLLPVVLTAALTSLATLYFARRFDNVSPFASSSPVKQAVNYAAYENSKINSIAPVDFQPAAEASISAVVHIKTTKNARTVVAQDPGLGDDFFGGLFGQRQYYIPPQMGSGSGVVISPDGYIVTNNHVVAGTDQVTVTFNNRYTAQAKVVSTDPSTDLAVLKVNEKNLPFMEFGNSDDVHIGQWVLAVGYPLTLDATVTAGIVSAKGRSIGINRSQSPNAIESFIQTDAAVNPGNSGGALVNTAGQLIGINAAIASPTGSYAGYSYAIPANIVRKVVGDLTKYGSVQRAYLGVEYLDPQSVTPEKLHELGIDKNAGVYVAGVSATGGAAKAGISAGDFITKINTSDVHGEPELLEQLARYQPGDNITVTYTRNGEEKTTNVLLKNLEGTTDLVKSTSSVKALGASFRMLTDNERTKLGIKSGALVTDLGEGSLLQSTNMKKGFVITSVNDEEVSSVTELQQILSSGKSIQIAGFYPGNKGMYYYGLNGNR